MNHMVESRAPSPESRMLWPAVARAFRRAAPPLAWYYAVTLALPLANGAAQAGATFVEHALIVLVLPPVLIVLASVTREMARAIARKSGPVIF